MLDIGKGVIRYLPKGRESAMIIRKLAPCMKLKELIRACRIIVVNEYCWPLYLLSRGELIFSVQHIRPPNAILPLPVEQYIVLRRICYT